MNRKEVYINGILIDLDESKSPIQLIYSVNNLAELKDRQAYSTNTFKAPKTPNNLSACGLPDNAALIQVQPYRRNGAKVVQGGIEVLTNGIAIIKSTGKDIEIQILSGLVGFFDKLGEKKLSDLDLSDYDHFWNLTNVAGSQNNTAGYIYPVIDYGGLSPTDREADARQLRPATFRKTIIEAIIAEAGYTASGICFSYPKYLQSLVAFSSDKFTHGKSYSDMLAGYSVKARNNADVNIDPGVLATIFPMPDSTGTDPAGQWSGSVFTAGIAQRTNLTFKYSIQQVRITIGGSTPEYYVSIQKLSGGVWNDLAGNLTTQSANIGEYQDFLNQQINAVVDLLPGDQVRIQVLQQPAINRLYAKIYAGANFAAEPVVEDVIYGSEVQLAATLPDVTQKDFFKDFLQNFGLIVIPDNYKQELLLINLEEVYDNIPNAQDITDKLINTDDDILYAFGSYGVNNYGKYKADEAVPTDTGTGLMVFDNQTLDKEVTIIDSIFAASIKVFKLGGLFVTEIKKIEDITKSSEFKTKTQPRILLDVKVNTGFRFFDDSASQTVSLISLPVFDGLSYQTLFDENYPELLQMLYRPFITRKEILLDEVDIASIDWRIPVYDKKSAAYYYKNEIVYLQGDVSTISLIKMPGKFVPDELPPTPEQIKVTNLGPVLVYLGELPVPYETFIPYGTETVTLRQLTGEAFSIVLQDQDGIVLPNTEGEFIISDILKTWILPQGTDSLWIVTNV